MHPAETLFVALFRGLQEGEWIETRAFNQGPEHDQTYQWWIAQPAAIFDLIMPEMENFYFGVNPRKGKTSRNVDVSRIITFIADLDVRDKPLTPAAAHYGIEPSAIVKSGGGYHLYWFLAEDQGNTPEHAELRRTFCALGPSDAVHDAARILRVPGTLNTKYGEPRLVEVLKCDPQLRYPNWVFEKIIKVPDATRKRMYTGDVSGFRSRSERDWGILRHLIIAGFTDDEIKSLAWTQPWGDRVRDRWPDLLNRDIETLRNLGPAHGGRAAAEIFVTDAGDCYMKEGANGPVKLSTFTLEPTALLEGESEDEDYVVANVRAEGTTHTWSSVTLPKRAFIDRRSLNRALKVAAWSWLGTDADTVKLLPYLMQQIQSKGVPMLRLVRTLGRYGMYWITPEDVLTSTGHISYNEAGFSFLDSHQERPKVKYPQIPDIESRQFIRAVFPHIMQVNCSEVMLPVLCWFFASAYKPVLSPFGREFPILQVVGTQGVGKTSLVRGIMLPLFGYQDPISYSCDTTDFVLLSLMASSTSIPVALAEFRSSISNLERLLRRLRLTYDTGYDARGRPDQTTRSYSLNTPICVDGEMPVDDAAIRERSVIVTLHPQDLTDERRAAFLEASKLLAENKFAEAYIRWTLQHPPKLVEAEALMKTAWPEHLPDRMRKSAERLLVGYMAMQEYLGEDFPLSDPTPEIVRGIISSWLGGTLLADTGRTAILIDEFIEDAINAIRRDGTDSGEYVGKSRAISSARPFIWRLDRGDRTISIHLVTAINWWAQQRRSRGQVSLTRAAALSQLRERIGEDDGQYIRGYKTMQTSVGPTMLYTIFLDAAVRAGLDIPGIRGGNE